MKQEFSRGDEVEVFEGGEWRGADIVRVIRMSTPAGERSYFYEVAQGRMKGDMPYPQSNVRKRGEQKHTRIVF